MMEGVQRGIVRMVQVVFPGYQTSKVPKRLQQKVPDKELTIFKDKNYLKLSDLMGKYIAVLGLRGTGKSNTGAVIIEELLSNSVPVTIIDIDGEHVGMKNKFPIEIYDYKHKIKDVRGFVHRILSKNIAVLFDLSHFPTKERDEFLTNYLNELWEQEETLRVPHFVVVEEAHEFIPQGRNAPPKEILTRIALRGRKKGLGSVLISQRSAKVDKDVLSQADIYILHKVIHPSDMGVYFELVPDNRKDVQTKIRSLQTGQAIYVRDGQYLLVNMRIRATPHGGHTPGLGKLRPLGRKILPW